MKGELEGFVFSEDPGYVPSTAEVYMNDKQLRYFGAVLDHLQNKTTEMIKADIMGGGFSGEDVHISTRQSRLEKIKAAKKAIAMREYGYCDDTGEDIGIRRLVAEPTSLLSVQAQSDREVRDAIQNAEDEFDRMDDLED